MGRGFERVKRTYGQKWGEVLRGLNKHMDRDRERLKTAGHCFLLVV